MVRLGVRWCAMVLDGAHDVGGLVFGVICLPGTSSSAECTSTPTGESSLIEMVHHQHQHHHMANAHPPTVHLNERKTHGFEKHVELLAISIFHPHPRDV